MTTLASTIKELSINTDAEPTPEQLELLGATKKSLFEKVASGKQFHSLKIHGFTVKTEQVGNSTSIRHTPDEESLLMRGITVGKLTADEETLAKEVFGVVIKQNGDYFLPVDITKTDKFQDTLENVELKFSNALDGKGTALAKGAVTVGGGIGGASSLISQYGAKVLLNNVVAKFAGGAIMSPGMLPVLGGVAVAGAAVGAAYAVPPLTRKIMEVRQAIKDKNDGDERQMAKEAITKMDYQTIISTQRSDLLPQLEQKIQSDIAEQGREYNVRTKLRK